MNDNRAPAPRINGVTGTRASAPWDAAVVIPARNEARRIQPCLMALADAIERTPATVGVILCVNDTQDDTASLGAAILKMCGVSHLILDLEKEEGCIHEDDRDRGNGEGKGPGQAGWEKSRNKGGFLCRPAYGGHCQPLGR